MFLVRGFGPTGGPECTEVFSQPSRKLYLQEKLEDFHLFMDAISLTEGSTVRAQAWVQMSFVESAITSMLRIDNRTHCTADLVPYTV